MTRILMLQILTLLTSVLATVTPVATAAFTFDGPTSDLAQQLFLRHQANSSADRIKLLQRDIPQPVPKRLDPYKRTFDALGGLLQRALLWDTGYVLGPVSQLLKVYTTASKSMEDIAVSTTEFTAIGCTCADSYGQMALRSKFCSGTQAAALKLLHAR